MSPKSRGRKRKRSEHHRPDGRQREHEPSQLQIPPEVMREILDHAAQFAEAESPLPLEVAVSGMLSSAHSDIPLDLREESESAFGAALVDELRADGGTPARLMLAGLAALGSAPTALRARTAFEELGTAGLPAWISRIGRAELVEALRADDAYGDGVQLVLAFRYDDEQPHGLAATIDHGQRGALTDAWTADVADELLTGLREISEQDGLATVTPIDASDAAGLITTGYAVLDQSPPTLPDDLDIPDDLGDLDLGDLDEPGAGELEGYQVEHSEEADESRALVLARLPSLPTPAAPPRQTYGDPGEPAELVADFESSPEASGLDPDLVVGLGELIVAHGVANDLGGPLRVSPSKLGSLMHRLAEAVAPEDADAAFDVIRAWVRFAGRRTELREDLLEGTLATVDELSEMFEVTVEDPELVQEYEKGLAVLLADVDPESVSQAELENIVQRRAFALPGPPRPGFDPDDEDSFLQTAADEHVEDVGHESDQLHGAVHAAVARQLWFDQPPEVWQTAQRLLGLEYDRHDVLHALGSVVAAQIFAVTQGSEPSEEEYREALAALPESWEATAEPD